MTQYCICPWCNALLPLLHSYEDVQAMDNEVPQAGNNAHYIEQCSVHCFAGRSPAGRGPCFVTRRASNHSRRILLPATNVDGDVQVLHVMQALLRHVSQQHQSAFV